MRRLLSLCLCLALVGGTAGLAAEPSEPLWTREEGDGSYVTIRVPCSEEQNMLGWADQRQLTVRYGDTGEPVPLTSDYQRGYFFATIPARDAHRPLGVVHNEEHRFPDLVRTWEGNDYYSPPGGAEDLYLRGVIEGDQHGNLNPAATLTRAEVFTLICRLLSLEPGGDPGYGDVAPGDWYYDAVSAARTAGVAAEDERFHPARPVTRGEVTVMLARAMETVGWLRDGAGTLDDLAVVDAGDIPSWALDSYRKLAPHGVGIFTHRDTEALDEEGLPIQERLAEWERVTIREEVIALIDNALRFLPVYPRESAIAWGFDKEMPVVDGSTSTYPYTRALYSTLFANYDGHPQYPAAHSKSHTSYERLIDGQVDVLFAATKPSRDLEEQAKAAGVELECIPIAYDAMVFFTNGENSIQGLTREQIRDIYVDNAYRNWAEVGGPEAELLPYRRNTDSGSHALMEQFFLEGGALSLSPDVHNVYTSYAMTSALTDVAQALRTDPPAYAIGYSVYYYYTNGYWLLGDAGGGELKLLAVDGVLPSDETIADGSYPLAGYNYAVVRKEEPEDSPARRLVAFMLSEEGQTAVAGAGFGPLWGDAKADFAREMPQWGLEEISPLDFGYVVLSRNREGTVQRASYLERGASASWHELTGAECPAPTDAPLSWALLGTRSRTVVFGTISSQASDGILRLTDGEGDTQTYDIHPGGSFSFLLEREREPKLLEILRPGQEPIPFELS